MTNLDKLPKAELLPYPHRSAVVHVFFHIRSEDRNWQPSENEVDHLMRHILNLEAALETRHPTQSATPDGLRSAIVAEIQKRRQCISKNDSQDKWGRGWDACAIGFCDELEKLLAASSLAAQGEE